MIATSVFIATLFYPTPRRVGNPPPRLPQRKAYEKLKGTKEIKSKKVSQELEKKYLVSKTVEGLRKKKIEKSISYEKALDWLITKHLGFSGPQAKEEIALELKLPEEIINQSLYDLEEQGIIQGGNFILGRNMPQYLLAEDVIYLEAQPRTCLGYIQKTGLTVILEARELLAYRHPRHVVLAKFYQCPPSSPGGNLPRRHLGYLMITPTR